VSGYHDAHLRPDPSRRIVWTAVAAHLSRWINPGARVLEIGAGYCDWINQVRATQRVAVDIWPEFGTFASSDVEAIVLDAATNLRTLGEASYDVVLASNVLEHFVPDTAAAVVADVAAVLKPGGRIILIQPNFRLAWRRYFDDYTHRAIFTDVSLPALLTSRGFSTELVEARFLPYSMRQTALPIRPWLVAAYLRSPIKPLAGQMLVIARKD
jgi:cyclopropane fatty-acyl-phospholipid synthase-like methyltransferase